MKFAFLFGAGASYGASDDSAHRPPLGLHLYPALIEAFPNTWGSMPPDLDEAFRHPTLGFENGMGQLWEQGTDLNHAAVVDISVYFARFRLPPGNSDRYSHLIAVLKHTGKLEDSSFASLNYECLVDEAVAGLGLTVVYDRRSMRLGCVLLSKPHGACNIVAAAGGNGHLINVKFLGGPNWIKSDVKVIGLDDVVNNQIRGIPSAMSIYSTGKPSPVGATYIEEMRVDWASSAAAAATIVVIGARPLLTEDLHVWGPVVDSSAPIWYVGGTNTSEYKDLAEAVGKRLTHLGDRFDVALAPLLSLITDR